MSLPALLSIIGVVCDEKQAADTAAHLSSVDPPSTLAILSDHFKTKFGTGAAVVKAKVESVKASCELHSDAPRVQIFRGMVRPSSSTAICMARAKRWLQRPHSSSEHSP